MCFDRGPKDSQIKTVRPDSFNCFSGGFSWLKIWWPNTTKGADGCDGIPVIFGVPDLTPTTKGLHFFGNFDLISKVIRWVVNILCGTSYILPRRWWGSTSYCISGVMGPQKKPLGFQPHPPHKASEGFHGSGAHLEGLWVWQVGSKAQDRTGESGQGLGGLATSGRGRSGYTLSLVIMPQFPHIQWE